jgi:hypothetical protein
MYLMNTTLPQANGLYMNALQRTKRRIEKRDDYGFTHKESKKGSGQEASA